MDNPIRYRYPTICRILDGKKFNADIDRAAELAAQPDGRDGLKQAIKAKSFSSTRLLTALASNTLIEFDDYTATALEHDLAKLVGRLGEAKVRKVYGDKLLVDKQFEDTVYEVAVTAVCSDFFDPGTLALEEGIAGSRSGKKNSDIKGERGGRKYRIEVTVLHNEWPPRLDEDFQEVIEQADIESGYTVVLAQPITTRAGAEEVRRLIENLYAARKAAPGTDLKVDGIEYLDCGGEYYPPADAPAPITRIEFNDDKEFRLVGSPAVSRNTLDPQEWVKIKATNPEGVVTSMDLKHDPLTHQATPASTKIWQTLQKKLTQCEPEHVNVVVLGQPNPPDDREWFNALTGAVVAGVEYTEDDLGRRVSGDARPFRLASGPFVPADRSEDPDQFVEPFRRLSAVWVVRLSSAYPLSKMVLNPNAAVPLDVRAARDLAGMGQGRAEAGRGVEAPKEANVRLSILSGRPAAVRSPRPTAESQEDVTRGIALELVGIAGGLAEARAALDRLEQMHAAGQRFVPSVQEGPGVTVDTLDVAQEFVDCCGGFDAARTLLASIRTG